MKLTVLGSGTSHGVPVIGCDCAVCLSADPKDYRMRASLHIKGRNGESAVIDTGPEFRLQALRAGIKKLDAVFLTHEHADHIHGLDDVRSFWRKSPLPVYCSAQAKPHIQERFSYVFKDTGDGEGKPQIDLIAVCGAAETVKIGSLAVTPVPVMHGSLEILGWRIEDSQGGQAAVYLTDLSEIPRASLAVIGSPEILIIGALRTRPHKKHFTFEQALEAAAGIKARQVFLTHICHERSHEQIQLYCDSFVKERNLSGISMSAAWDGLTLALPALS